MTLENTYLNDAEAFSLLKYYGFNLNQPLFVLKSVIEFSII